MKSAYADVIRSVGCFAEVIWREIQLSSSVIHASFESDARGVGLREDLSAVTYLLGRQHDELLARIKELFGMPIAPEDQQRIEDLFRPSASQPIPTRLEWLHASVSARLRLCREVQARFDSHTRFVFRIQDCLSEGMILPTLERHVDGAAALQPGSVFVSAYADFVPDERQHHDDFLKQMLSATRT